MKMRVLTATKKGKLLTIADAVAKKCESTYAADVIPPAYSCDRERLVLIIATAAPSMPNAFQLFCRDLGRDRTQNVAFIMDGTPENAAKIVEMVKSAGTNVIDDILYINGGLPFKFMKKVTPEEEATVNAWVDKILTQLK